MKRRQHMARARYINTINCSTNIVDNLNNIGVSPSEYPEKPEIDQKHARCCDDGLAGIIEKINILNKEPK